MAARQDQTLQIALIIFVGLTVILGGFLVYVNRLKADYRDQLAAAKQQQQDEQGRGRQLNNEKLSYLQFMGFGQDEDFEEVKKQYEQDMQTLAPTFQEADRSYRTLVLRFDTENKRSTDQESQAKQREKELKERLVSIEAQHKAQLTEAEKTIQQVRADLAKEQEQFRQDRAGLEKQRDELLAASERQRVASEQQLSQLNSQISELTTQRDRVAASRDQLLEDRKQESASFEVADGNIAWINQANRTVWINLGSRDSLRRQVTFSVFDQSSSDAGKAEKKASIEVTRLLGDHMAEARITDDDARNPILPGDQIYSQVWHRGKAIHFALTGELDIDGDGTADLQQAKDLITLNGGVIDAAVNDAGGWEGKMSVETRYLVRGDFPNKPSQSALRTSFVEMEKEAEQFGVESITLGEFLNQMGYKPLDKTIVTGQGGQLSGPKAGGSGFRPRSAYFGL